MAKFTLRYRNEFDVDVEAETLDGAICAAARGLEGLVWTQVGLLHGDFFEVMELQEDI